MENRVEVYKKIYAITVYVYGILASIVSILGMNFWAFLFMCPLILYMFWYLDKYEVSISKVAISLGTTFFAPLLAVYIATYVKKTKIDRLTYKIEKTTDIARKAELAKKLNIECFDEVYKEMVDSMSILAIASLAVCLIYIGYKAYRDYYLKKEKVSGNRIDPVTKERY